MSTSIAPTNGPSSSSSSSLSSSLSSSTPASSSTTFSTTSTAITVPDHLSPTSSSSSKARRRPGSSMVDAKELVDLAEFASRGGIGKGVALTDCVAQTPDQLMYIRGDHLILLRDLGDGYLLASCEGVVGWVEEECVKLEQGLDLKGVVNHGVTGIKAVDGQAQASTGRASPSPLLSPPSSPVQSIPKTVVVAPSPPGKIASLPLPLPLPEVRITDMQQDSTPAHDGHGEKESKPQLVSHANRSGYLVQSSDSPSGSTAFAKRISSPFELDSPLPSPTPTPTRDKVNPFDSHAHSHSASSSGTDARPTTKTSSRSSLDDPGRTGSEPQQNVELERDTNDSPDDVYRPSPLDVDVEGVPHHDLARKLPSTHEAAGDVENRNRESILSTTSSEALGGIGGFMMGGEEVGGVDLESTEELTAIDTHPPSFDSHASSPRQLDASSRVSPLQSPIHASKQSASEHAGKNGPTPIGATTGHRNGDEDGVQGQDLAEGSSDWDIYGDYARESMYYKRQSTSTSTSAGNRRSMKAFSMAESDGGMESFSLFKAAMASSSFARARHDGDDEDVEDPEEGMRDPDIPKDDRVAAGRDAYNEDKGQGPSLMDPALVSSATGKAASSMTNFDPTSFPNAREESEIADDPETPKPNSRSAAKTPRTPGDSTPGFTGRSLATELRLRIQRERQNEAGAISDKKLLYDDDEVPSEPKIRYSPAAAAPAVVAAASPAEAITASKPALPPRSSSRPTPMTTPGAALASAVTSPSFATPAFLITDENDTPTTTGSGVLTAEPDSVTNSQSPVEEVGNDSISSVPYSDRSDDYGQSDQSIIIETPNPPGEGVFSTISPVEIAGGDDIARQQEQEQDQEQEGESEREIKAKQEPEEVVKVANVNNAVLASPIPLDEPRSTQDSSKYPTRGGPIRPQASRQGSSALNLATSFDSTNPPILSRANTEIPQLGSGLLPPPPLPPTSAGSLSPVHNPPTPKFAMTWSPNSPSSPHSIAATRQAVDAARSTSTPDATGTAAGSGLAGPNTGLTLVGRMDADLRGSKGPVPITFLVGGPGMPLIPSAPSSHDGHGSGSGSGSDSRGGSASGHGHVHSHGGGYHSTLNGAGLGLGLPSPRFGAMTPQEGSGPGSPRSASSPTAFLSLTDSMPEPPHLSSDSRFPRPPSARSASYSHPSPGQGQGQNQSQPYSRPHSPAHNQGQGQGSGHHQVNNQIPGSPLAISTPSTPVVPSTAPVVVDDGRTGRTGRTPTMGPGDVNTAGDMAGTGPASKSGSGSGSGSGSRARSRSISAAFAKAVGRSKKNKDKENEDVVPPMPMSMPAKSESESNRNQHKDQGVDQSQSTLRGPASTPTPGVNEASQTTGTFTSNGAGRKGHAPPNLVIDTNLHSRPVVSRSATAPSPSLLPRNSNFVANVPQSHSRVGPPPPSAQSAQSPSANSPSAPLLSSAYPSPVPTQGRLADNAVSTAPQGSRSHTHTHMSPGASSPMQPSSAISTHSPVRSARTTSASTTAQPALVSTDSLSLSTTNSVTAPPSARSATFSFSSRGNKTPKKSTSALPTTSIPLLSPVSHKDYAEETVKADGMDFEIVQPPSKSAAALFSGSTGGSGSVSGPGSGSGSGPNTGLGFTSGELLSPQSIGSPRGGNAYFSDDDSNTGHGTNSNNNGNNNVNMNGSSSPRSPGAGAGAGAASRPGISRSETLKSDISGISGMSSRSQPLPETDEWGFLKEKSPTPEMFQSRNTPGEHRVAEQKWLGIVSTPLPPHTPAPKKAKKLALEGGIPASLRGRVWAWFMSGTMSARRPGLYAQLLEHERSDSEGRLERDVASVYADHATFSSPSSPGTSDLRSLLRAYSNFAPSGYHPELSLIAGMLLIHCVVEDAFWLLNGLVGNVMNQYFTDGEAGLKIDAAVFGRVLAGSEVKLAKKFREMGIHPLEFLAKWYKQLFLRCLPWPTALRVVDGVIAEGPRFLLVASLSILTLSRDRILPLENKAQVLNYLHNLPQDALLLPETFMKACSEVRFRDEDWKRMRAGVEKELGLGPVM